MEPKDFGVVESRLKAPFPKEKIQWRVGHARKYGDKWKVMILCYIDARDVQNRLDEVVGADNWMNAQPIETASGRILQGISLKINGEWVTKWDGAGATATEGEKGGISDGFKRAAVMWGVGRYLYDSPTVFAETSSSGGKGWNRHGKGSDVVYWRPPKGAVDAVGTGFGIIGAEDAQAGEYPSRPPKLEPEDKVPAELIDFLSPLKVSATADSVDLAIDDLNTLHNRKAWGKGQEKAKVTAWLDARKAVLSAESKKECGAIYRTMLDRMGYASDVQPASMDNATDQLLANWMIDICSERIIEVNRAA